MHDIICHIHIITIVAIFTIITLLTNTIKYFSQLNFIHKKRRHTDVFFMDKINIYILPIELYTHITPQSQLQTA